MITVNELGSYNKHNIHIYKWHLGYINLKCDEIFLMSLLLLVLMKFLQSNIQKYSKKK